MKKAQQKCAQKEVEFMFEAVKEPQGDLSLKIEGVYRGGRRSMIFNKALVESPEFEGLAFERTAGDMLSECSSGTCTSGGKLLRRRIPPSLKSGPNAGATT